jgi:hypothetical protein
VNTTGARRDAQGRPPGDANALQHAAPDLFLTAVQRLERLHGTLELKSGLLALLMQADSQRARRAFELETVDVRASAEIHAHVRHLGAARLPWFERLAERMALQPLSARQEVLRAARRVMAARGVVRPLDLLHWLALRRALGERPARRMRRPAPPHAAEWLAGERLAMAHYAAFLSRMVPVDGLEDVRAPAGADWYAAAIEPWQLAPMDPPDSIGMRQALGVLQTLPMLQRPVLLRGWTEPAIRMSAGGRLADCAADALRLTSSLLDSPMPPALARHYSGAEPPTP